MLFLVCSCRLCDIILVLGSGIWFSFRVSSLFIVLMLRLLLNFMLYSLLMFLMGRCVDIWKCLLFKFFIGVVLVWLYLLVILLMIFFSMFLMLMRLVIVLYLLISRVMWLWLCCIFCSNVFSGLEFGMNIVGCIICVMVVLWLLFVE